MTGSEKVDSAELRGSISKMTVVRSNGTDDPVRSLRSRPAGW